MADVPSIIDGSTKYAGDWVSSSQSLIDKMSSFADLRIDYPDGSTWDWYDYVDYVKEYIGKIREDAPDRPKFEFPDGVTPPDAPNISDFTAPDKVSIDPFGGKAQPLDIGDVPKLEFPNKGYDAPPEFTPPTIGDGPEIDINKFGPLPRLDEIRVPDMPRLPTIDFTAVAPSNSTLTPPSEVFSFNEQDYSSELLNLLRLKLQADLTNGGYGIETNDELKLWDRAREREMANANQSIDDIEREFSSRRFSVPPGTFFGALEKSRQALQDASSTFNREVALKRADLYVQNRQFTIQQGSQLEGALIQYHGSMMERLLNASKYLIDAAIASYNARVTAYNAMLDGYKTEAQVFESKLRANGLLLDQYRATAEVEKIRADVNMTRINQYKAGIEAYDTLVNLYRTQVEAANVKASVEKLKLDAFRAQVEAYISQVQAKSAEFNAFEAKARGELGKAQIFDAQVRSYAGTVEAAKAKTEAESLVLKSQIEKARADIEKYNSQITQYRTMLETKLQVEGLKERVYGADIQAYESRVRSQQAIGDLAVSSGRVNLESHTAVMANNINKSKLELEKAVKQADINFGAAQATVGVYSGLITAALNSINALAVQTKSE
jgi:hypothetical protein